MVSFVCLLYGCNGCLSLNRLRVNRVLENERVNRKLPPTDDSFILHALQCSYQIMVWRESLTSVQIYLRRQIMIMRLTLIQDIQMVSQPLAQPELLNDLVCFCGDLCSADCVR